NLKGQVAHVSRREVHASMKPCQSIFQQDGHGILHVMSYKEAPYVLDIAVDRFIIHPTTCILPQLSELTRSYIDTHLIRLAFRDDPAGATTWKQRRTATQRDMIRTHIPFQLALDPLL